MKYFSEKNIHFPPSLKNKIKNEPSLKYFMVHFSTRSSKITNPFIITNLLKVAKYIKIKNIN